VFQTLADFLKEWHRLVAEKDLGALHSVLVDDVSIGAPPYWNRLEGRDLVHHLLGQVISSIDDFTYHRQWEQGSELALEFTGKVNDLDLQGIDLITLDGELRVAKLDVLMRPVNAVIELRGIIAPRMAEFLAARAEAGAQRPE